MKTHRSAWWALVTFLVLLAFTGDIRAADNQLTDAEKQAGWILLFDGQSLNGWLTSGGKPSQTPVQQGCLNPHGCGDYMLIHTQQWSDCVLALDFKLSQGCNSGIFLRTYPLTPLPGKDVGYNGIEIQLIDSTAAGYHDTGAVYDLAKPTRNAMRPAGEWNHIEIVSKANCVEVCLNGEWVNRVDLSQFTIPNRRPDGSEHKFAVAYSEHPRRGYIGLQDHGSDCWFKNIKLLPETTRSSKDGGAAGQLAQGSTACLVGEAVLGVELKRTTLNIGDLSVEFRDNSESPKILSGVDRLLHIREAPDFDAFDPNDPGSSAGLNFEHIISGHANPANWFAPRNGTYRLHSGTATNSVVLVRKAEDDPWGLESTMTYTVTAPQAIDFEFRCRAHDERRFGRRRYAVLFWADYMNDVEDVALHFRGVSGPGAKEQWLAADAPVGPPDYVGGGTYRHLAAAPLQYDADHNLKLNLWSYEYPRFTVACYYGLAAQGMTLILMFDRGWSAEDEIRFSLFKFKVSDRVRRPAWDFQYVIHRVETGKLYGYRGRLIWKKFVSPEDCLQEYETWVRSLPAGTARPAASGSPRSAPEPNASPATLPPHRVPGPD